AVGAEVNPLTSGIEAWSDVLALLTRQQYGLAGRRRHEPEIGRSVFRARIEGDPLAIGRPRRRAGGATFLTEDRMPIGHRSVPYPDLPTPVSERAESNATAIWRERRRVLFV